MGRTTPASGTVSTVPRKPTRAEIAAAVNREVPDLLASDLRVLFCGINPGLYTAAVGHHFARPGNRFWPALYGAGFTPRLFAPWDEHELLALGYGITNMVQRTTAAASELSRAEYLKGGERLGRIVTQYRPAVVAFMGIGAYRHAFSRPDAVIGLQRETLGVTALWVLPSPSGLNANHQLGDLIALLRELRLWVESSTGSSTRSSRSSHTSSSSASPT